MKNSVQLLHTNDFHGALTPEKAAAIRKVKEESGALYFDCGDCVKAGNLAIPLKPERAWPLLAEAGCDAGTIGNRESHLVPAAFNAKIAGHVHPLLCANLRAKDGSHPLAGSMIIEKDGMRIGLLGVMVAMVTRRMATQAASAYLWDPPVATAIAVAKELRPQVDLLIALTHIGFKADQELAARGEDIDIILGGHSHTVIERPIQIGKTWICQAGSHGRYVGKYEWREGRLSGVLAVLPPK